jgi:hypothetical protein
VTREPVYASDYVFDTGSYKQKLWMKRKGDVPFWGCAGGQPQDPG